MNKIKIKNKKILIIGGAGFIGHNLALKLKEYQADVIIIDGLTVNNLYAIQQNKLQLPYPKLASTILNERQKLLKKLEYLYILRMLEIITNYPLYLINSNPRS